MTEKLANWAENIAFSAARVHRPETVEQVQELVRRCRKLRVLGARHSFNAIADSSADLVSLENMPPMLMVDRERHTVTVNAGARYGELCGPMHAAGFALHNLASLPHISVAGACATATHGSGDRNANLASAVSALELVMASGDLVTWSRTRDGDLFLGAVVGLGGLGVVTKVTLDVVPAFDMRQDVYEQLHLTTVEAHFDEILSSAYSVSLFTDWQSRSFGQVWFKRRVAEGDAFEPAPRLFEATLAPSQRHPLVSLSAEPCTEQMGIRGPWHERLPHFRMQFTPSTGEELQTEYFVHRGRALEAFRAIDGLREQLAGVLKITEVRTIAADELWMSMCYQRPSVAIHFTWQKAWEAVKALLPRIEEALAPFDARPHWGKLFALSPARLQALYPRLTDFQNLLRRYDPEGKFRNAFLDKNIFDET